MATTFDLTGDYAIRAGDDYGLVLNLVDPDGAPLDVDGYTFAAQLRRNHQSTEAVSFAVTVENTTGPLVPTTVLLSLTDAQTALMVGASCPKVWDLEATADDGGPDEWTDTWFDGDVDVEPDVTRPVVP